MASYGIFLAACGYEYQGPKGHLGFAPRLTPEKFRAAFTTSEGWGTFEQTAGAGSQAAQWIVRWGKVRLRSVALGVAKDFQPTRATVSVAGQTVPATLTAKDGRAVVQCASDMVRRAETSCGWN